MSAIANLITAWVDTLNAPLSDSSERLAVLNQIELHLGTLCGGLRSSSTLSILDFPTTEFWSIQSHAGFSLGETLLQHLTRLHILLQQEMALFQLTLGLRSGSTSEVERQRVQALVSEACTSLTLLQGLALSHRPTKRICERKGWMELLLAIVLSEYSTDLLPSMLGEGQQQSLPCAFALEMLMCILVDSPQAQHLFSDIGGLQQIVQLSHRCGDAVALALEKPTQLRPVQVDALKQTDLHCLEFRYFLGQLHKQSEPKTLQGTSKSAFSFVHVRERRDSAATLTDQPEAKGGSWIMVPSSKETTPKKSRTRLPSMEDEHATPKPNVLSLSTSSRDNTRPPQPERGRARSDTVDGSHRPKSLRPSSSVANLKGRLDDRRKRREEKENAQAALPLLLLPKKKGSGITRTAGAGPGIVARLAAREAALEAPPASPSSRFPPSPAVRRAQMARARSLSPQKQSRPA